MKCAFRLESDFDRHSNHRKCVQNIVLAGKRDSRCSQQLVVVIDIEGIEPVIKCDILGIEIAILLEPEGLISQVLSQSPENVCYVGILAVGNEYAVLFGAEREFAEGLDYLIFILVVIKMVLLDIEYAGNFRLEVQKAPVVFTGLCYEVFAICDSGRCAQLADSGTYNKVRIYAGLF